MKSTLTPLTTGLISSWDTRQDTAAFCSPAPGCHRPKGQIKDPLSAVEIFRSEIKNWPPICAAAHPRIVFHFALQKLTEGIKEAGRADGYRTDGGRRLVCYLTTQTPSISLHVTVTDADRWAEAQAGHEPTHLEEERAGTATRKGTNKASLSSLSPFPVHVWGSEPPWCHYSSLGSHDISWKANFLSITLAQSCWWPHKSHVNELWERPISHHARCAFPLLFMAIIGLCFLRQWLCTDGSDDDSAQPSHQQETV